MQDRNDDDVRSNDESRGEALAKLRQLVKEYERQREALRRRGALYNEAQVRVDFINPLLKLLGWDVENQRGVPQHLRDVVQEDAVSVEEGDEHREKNPDYGFRVGGRRKFFLEGKKPSVAIESDRKSAFQTRRYGWSAGMKISVLSNFEYIAVYDTRYVPNAEDGPQTARRRLYHYTEYEDRFDEIHALLSRDAVYTGSIDSEFADIDEPGAEPFDRRFLKQIEHWREALSAALLADNEGLTSDQINDLVQRLVNRVVFLRVCEGRQIEGEERLRAVSSYDELKDLYAEADRRYNSGLFDFAEDQLSLNVSIGSQVLVDMFQDLYMPNSPYAFSVVTPEILGEIYEEYLGREVQIADGDTRVVQKPEVVQTSGVVVTPSPVAARIVEETLGPRVDGKSPDELRCFSVADLSCGSGTFLLAAYTYLLNHHLQWYLVNDPANPALIEGEAGNFYLSFEGKRRILLDMVFGVDIDLQAVEVTRFGLLLKLLDGETAEAITVYAAATGQGALPNLAENIRRGNSLVDGRYYTHDPDAELDTDLIDRVLPTDFPELFPKVFARGGFDTVVGNPPYVRIQNIAEYSPEEHSYYRGGVSPYETAAGGSIDKYFLFVERALQLIKPSGRVGYVVQNRFILNTSGEPLRGLLSSGKHLDSIADFGTNHVFPGRTTYSAVLILNGGATEHFTVEKVTSVGDWTAGKHQPVVQYPAVAIGRAPWVFATAAATRVFDRIQTPSTVPLKDVAHIFVGLQTSNDDIYIQVPENIGSVFDVGTGEFTTSLFKFEKNGRAWKVETDLLVPCIYNAPVRPFQQVQPNAVMLFPYRSGTSDPYTPEEMAASFPHAWEYLTAYKTPLEARSISGGARSTWYRFGRSQSLGQFQGGTVLVWSVQALDAPYAVDEWSTRFTGGGHGPYYGLRIKPDSPVSLYYVLAVLSHPVIEALVRTKAVSFQSDYYPHAKQYMADLPILSPAAEDEDGWSLHDKIVTTAKALVRVATRLAVEQLTPRARNTLEAQRARLKKSLVDQVSSIYGLDEVDLRATSHDDSEASSDDEE